MAKKRAVLQREDRESTAKKRKISDPEVSNAHRPGAPPDQENQKHNAPSTNPKTQDIALLGHAPLKPTKQKSKHVRFDAEDLDNVAVPDAEENESTDPTSEVDSEDDAPDAISTSAAQKSSKASIASVTKALSQQRADEKRKRKERDARLKSQAKSNKSRKTAEAPVSQENDVDMEESRPSELSAESENNVAKDDLDAASSLDLLPAHLLEEDFTRRPTPSPPPLETSRSSLKIPQNFLESAVAKRKLVSREISLQSRNRQVGPVTVAVLREGSAFLAPKAERKSKTLREGWLRGRTGRGGKALIERKAVNQAFVRR